MSRSTLAVEVPATRVPSSAGARVRNAVPGAVAGTAAAAAGIGIAELMAGLLPGAPSLVVSIGNLLIDLQPPGAKDVVVDLFGTNDKLALTIAVVVGALLVAAWAGIVARRS